GYDFAGASAESAESGRGPRVIDLRCDARVYSERDSGCATRESWFSAKNKQKNYGRLADPEYYDTDERLAIQRIFGRAADRRGSRRSGPAGFARDAGVFDKPFYA